MDPIHDICPLELAPDLGDDGVDRLDATLRPLVLQRDRVIPRPPTGFVVAYGRIRIGV